MNKRTNGRGGARRGAGRPVADIQLDAEHAADLRRIMRHYGLPYGPDEASAFVMAWIDQEYAKIDEQYQQGAEWEGNIL